MGREYGVLVTGLARRGEPAEPRTATSTTPTEFRAWADEVLRPEVVRAEALAVGGPAE